MHPLQCLLAARTQSSEIYVVYNEQSFIFLAKLVSMSKDLINSTCDLVLGVARQRPHGSGIEVYSSFKNTLAFLPPSQGLFTPALHVDVVLVLNVLARTMQGPKPSSSR